MATRIRKAWCSALKLAYPDYASLVHFLTMQSIDLIAEMLTCIMRNFINS